MADEPISALTTLVTYNSGDYLEILDVGDFSFASTGTNKKVTVANLISLAGIGSVMVASGASHAAGIAPDPGSSAGTSHFLREDATWALPPGSVNGTTILASATAITGSMATIAGFTVSLPAAGTYELSGILRAAFSVTGTIGQNGFIVAQLKDTTNAVVVTGSIVLPLLGTVQVASTVFAFQCSGPIGPVVYTVTGSATIAVQAMFGGSGTVSTPNFNSDTNGSSILSYRRIY